MGTSWLRTVNDIVHDLAAGVAPGVALAVWTIRRRAEAALPADDPSGVLRALASALPIMFAALAVLVVTGVLRAAYRGYGPSGGGSATRTRQVLVKHAAFVAVFITAVVVAFGAVRP